MARFVLYHHKNLHLAKYAVECSTTLAAYDANKQLAITSLPQQHASKDLALLPTPLRRLLFFARPDLVICLDDGVRPTRPVFALELTNHVPAQDHWMQRFNHLVGCAVHGVPGAYVLPFGMPKHPSFPSELDHVFFYAYDRVSEIHETPIFIAEWDVVGGKTPKGDAKFGGLPDRNLKDIRLTFVFLERVLDAALHGQELSQLMKERLIVELRNRIRKRAYARVPEIKDFKRLSFNMKNNRPLTRSEFEKWLVNERGLKIPKDLPERIVRRDKTVIFVPQSERSGKSVHQLRAALNKRIQKKGGDPYLGQPLAFDYLFCRLGETPYERDANLVLDLAVLKFSDLAEFHYSVWKTSPLQHTDISKLKDIPTYTMHLKEGSAQVLKNVLRIYAYAADIIVFGDGLIYF